MIGESTLGDLKCLSIVMEIVVVQTLVSRRVLLRAILAALFWVLHLHDPENASVRCKRNL